MDINASMSETDLQVSTDVQTEVNVYGYTLATHYVSGVNSSHLCPSHHQVDNDYLVRLCAPFLDHSSC